MDKFRKIITALETTTAVVSVLGVVAKVKKDLRTHEKCEGEHNPCACSDRCLRCLWG